jgi:hypothetical protein
MRSLWIPAGVLVCAFALPAIAVAGDHGPVFSYATPANSEREFSFDSGIFGRSGSLGHSFPAAPEGNQDR